MAPLLPVDRFNDHEFGHAIGRRTCRRDRGAGTSGHDGGMTAPSEAGAYYFGACVDSVTGESDTTNNCSQACDAKATENGGTRGR